MKSLKILTLIIVISYTTGIISGFGQKSYLDDPKYGPDKDSRTECARNISLYQEYYNQKNYKDALPGWYKVFHKCPAASKNTLLRGAIMFNRLIMDEQDPAKKEALIDTLMKIYDVRIEYFGDESDVLARKGVDFLRYKSDNTDNIQKGYDILAKSIELNKEYVDISALLEFFKATETLYREAVIDNAKVVENYALVMENLDKQPPKYAGKVDQAKTNVDGIFENIGTTTEALVDLFEPKFKENPEDINLLKKITGLLEKAPDGKESELYFNAAEKLHTLEPSAKSALALGDMAKNRDDLDKASKFFTEAISFEQNKDKKAAIYLKLADISRAKEKFEESRSYAKKALEEDPNCGAAYIAIGHLYAASKDCGTDDLTKGAIYWVAVDKYIKAKQVDPSLSDEADKYINAYSSYFPAYDVIFYAEGVEEGGSYRVGCWINETTVVRKKK